MVSIVLMKPPNKKTMHIDETKYLCLSARPRYLSSVEREIVF